MFGALYWVIATRNYSATEVGIGNALLSLMQLISTLTQLNFGQALIRFLPVAGHRTRALVLWAYGIASIVATVVAVPIAYFCTTIVSPSSDLHMEAPFAAWFVLCTIAWSIFSLQDATYTGLRAAIWIPLENGIFGILKLALLIVFALVSVHQAIFVSWTLPLFSVLLVMNIMLFRHLIPSHLQSTNVEISPPNRKVLTRYIAGDYAGQIFTQLSSNFLPILVVILLSSEAGGFLLPAQTIWLAMNMLSLAITSSLVVESARDPEHSRQFARAMLKRIGVTVVPAAMVFGVLAPYVLAVFGNAYREQATLLLRLFMVSTLPRIVVAMWTAMKRLRNETAHLALVLGAQALILLVGTAVLTAPFGLDAVGLAALMSQLLPAVVLGPQVLRWLRGDRPYPTETRS